MSCLHSSVQQALCDVKEAIDKLSLILPISRHHIPVLPLPPTQSHKSTGLLLVGRVQPLTDGSVVISQGRKKYCHVLFAPPLSVEFRDALVYCSDYRTVYSHNSAPILEVLSSDVKALQHCKHYVIPPKLSLSPLASIMKWKKEQNGGPGIAAVVIAKSPVIRKGESARFMLEISSKQEKSMSAKPIAAFVIFMGAHAMRWWPFVHVGNNIALVNLKLGSLPNFSNRLVLTVVTSHVHIFNISCRPDLQKLSSKSMTLTQSSSQNTRTNAPARKRMRLAMVPSVTSKSSAEPRSSVIMPFHCSSRTLTYEGVITECLSDGRLRLDDTIFLHLGAEYSWCTGGEKAFACFRTGAVIEALNLTIAFQRGDPTTMFPTAKTNINILYFGNLPDDDPVCTRIWHRSPWHRYWTYLPVTFVLWAQELYDKMREKFKLWLKETQSMSDRDECDEGNLMVDRMLGSKHEPGLIEFLMEKLSGNDNLFKREQLPTHFYSSFLGCTSQTSDSGQRTSDCNYQYPATIVELAEAADISWRSSCSAIYSREPSLTPSRRVLTEVFSAKYLSEVLFKEVCKSKILNVWTGSNAVLIGTLEGSDSPTATARISDVTGSVFVEFCGNLDPALLGAVVIIEDFRVVVESVSGYQGQRSTFLFNVDEIKVLIDGPCVQYDSGKSQRPATQVGFCESGRSSLLHTPQSNVEIQSMSPEDIGIDEFPLVAIFVEQVSSIFDGPDGEPQFCISGRLLSCCKQRNQAPWTLLTTKEGSFYDCFMIVRGVASTSVRASLEEGYFYAIGCSDFQCCNDVVAECRSRAKRSNTDPRCVPLLTVSVQNGLWVEKLQLIDILPSEITNSSIDSNLPELLKTARSQRHSFQAWKSHSLFDVISPTWGSNASMEAEVNSSSFRNSSLVALSGTLMYYSVLPRHEPNLNSDEIWTSAGCNCIIRESKSSLMCVPILFPRQYQQPRGLIPGCSVQILNVKRRTYKDGSLKFTACEKTRIKMLDFGKGLTEQPPLCCHRPMLWGMKPLKLFPCAILWDFCPAASIKSPPGNCIKMFGLVRVNIVKLKHIEFFVTRHVSGCDTCKLLDGVGWCVGARAVVLIEDGTTHGELECCSFPVVMELLSANENESKMIRSELPKKNHLRDLCSNRDIPLYPTRSAQDEVLTSIRRLMGSMRRSVQIVVKNQYSKVSSSTKGASLIEEATVRGHNLGFGRKLFTAELPELHQVRLEALAVFDEAFWVPSNDSSTTGQLTGREIYKLSTHT